MTVTKQPFAKNALLRRRHEFELVRQQGVAAVGRYCVIRVLPPPDGVRRVAIVISRYYSKKAVVRNRARRLFREGYRELYLHLGDAWVVIRPRAALLDKTVKAQVICREMARLFARLGLDATSGAGDDGGGHRKDGNGQEEGC